MQVMVLGMHRSGTSALGAILEALGLNWGAPEKGLPPDADNPRGYWERHDVVEANDFLLEACHSRWDKVSPFSLDRLDQKKYDQFFQRAKSIRDEFDETPFFIKDPRLCLTASAWLPLLSHPIGLYVYRDPLQVAQSLAKRNGIPLPVGLALWQFYWLSISALSKKMPGFVIYHEELMKNPVSVVKQLFDFLKSEGVAPLQLPSETLVLSVIDPSLFRHRGGCEEQMKLMSQEQVALRQAFEQKKKIEEIYFPELSPQSWEWLKFYETTTEIRENLEEQLRCQQSENKKIKKDLAQLWKKAENWIQSLYREADQLLDSKEYRVGSAILLKRLRLRKREKGHLVDEILTKFQTLKKERKN